MTSPADIRSRTRAWVDAGIVDEVQAARIVAFEEGADVPAAPPTPVAPTPAPAAPAPAGSVARDRMSGSLGVLGGVLVGLGVLLTVAANWSDIGDVAKVVTIAVVLVLAHGTGLWADARGAKRWVGTTAYVVSTLVFAGGVFLLGQVFHVRAHDPLGFLVAAIAATAVALLAGRIVVGWIAAALWVAWAVHEFVLLLFEADDALRLVGACLLLGVTSFAIGLVLDGIAARHAGAAERDDRPVAADLHVLGTPLAAIAVLGLLGLLVPLSFLWHVDDDLGDAGFGIATVVGATVAIGAVALASRYADVGHRRALAGALAAVVVLVVLASTVPDGVVIGLLANVVLFGGGFGLALLGLVEERRWAYAWGVGWIVVGIVARYVDAMVAFELGGLGFIGVGLLLIGCGLLVGRSRRIWREREEAS